MYIGESTMSEIAYAKAHGKCVRYPEQEKNRRRVGIMETWYYTVVSIDGDYANLKRTDIASEDLKLVARALLLAEIYEGCRLKYEWMQYEIVEKTGASK